MVVVMTRRASPRSTTPRIGRDPSDPVARPSDIRTEPARSVYRHHPDGWGTLVKVKAAVRGEAEAMGGALRDLAVQDGWLQSGQEPEGLGVVQLDHAVSG